MTRSRLQICKSQHRKSKKIPAPNFDRRLNPGQRSSCPKAGVCDLNTKQNAPLTIVVVGLDKSGAPRASAYPADMTETAVKAAADWSLKIGRAESEEALKLAKDLPHGSLFPSLKFEPPSIKRELFNALIKNIQCNDPLAITYKDPWDMLEIGGTILCEEEPGEGYYLSKIIAMSKDRKVLTCAWVGYKGLPHFQVKRSLVGLISVIK